MQWFFWSLTPGVGSFWGRLFVFLIIDRYRLAPMIDLIGLSSNEVTAAGHSLEFKSN
jgi:hypothetical protein